MTQEFSHMVDYWLTRSNSTQLAICRRAKISPYTLQRILTKGSPIRRNTADRLFEALSIPSDEQDMFLLLSRGTHYEDAKRQTGKSMYYLPVKPR